MRSKLSPFLAALLLATACSNSADPAATPRVVTVNPNGTGDFLTIQDALDGTFAGSTILLEAGTYDERLVVAKGITLRGTGPATLVRVLGAPIAFRDESTGSSSAVITVTAVGASIENLAVSGPQDGIQLLGARATAVLDVVASGNGDDGVDVIGGDGIFLRGTFDDNGDQGVQLRAGATDVEIAGSAVNRNADRGVRIQNTLRAVVRSCAVLSNGSDGVHVITAAGTSVLGSRLSLNQGYGLHVTGTLDLVNSGNTFSGNLLGAVFFD